MKTNSFSLLEIDLARETAQEEPQFIPGVWLNGKCCWIHDGNERLLQEELVSFRMKRVHVHSKVRFYELFVTNHSISQVDVKLVIMHYYAKGGRDHFAFTAPSENVIFHFVDDKIFLVNGSFLGTPLESSTVQPFWNCQSNAIWGSLDKGQLKYQPLAQDNAASIFTLALSIPGKETRKGTAWMISGQDRAELCRLNEALLKNLH